MLPRCSIERDAGAIVHLEADQMTQPPLSARATVFLISLNALAWAAFGILTAAGALPSLQQPLALRWVFAGLALGAAAVLAALAVMLARRVRLAYFAALGILAAIAVLSITDQVGLADLISLTLVVLPIVLLLKNRSWFLRS
jgi:hypothetical protein